MNKDCANRRGLDLSKEVLWVSATQRAAELPAVKVEGQKKKFAGRPSSKPTRPHQAKRQNFF